MFAQVKIFLTLSRFIGGKVWFDQVSYLQRLTGYFFLSWVFALGAQVVIPLPFSLVPLVLNPFPLLVAAQMFGVHAIYAYVLYLAQGAFGLPVFIGLQAGGLYLLGPTGGYTFGFAGAMLFLALTRSIFSTSSYGLFFKLVACSIIYFCCGLAQLSFFVQPAVLLTAGLYPFILGDTCKLLAIVILFGRNSQKSHL